MSGMPRKDRRSVPMLDGRATTGLSTGPFSRRRTISGAAPGRTRGKERVHFVPKTKTKSRHMIADGVGGMAEVHDRRFEPAHAWPIHFAVPKERAENWFRYLEFECERRGWNSGGLTQLEARENSGSVTCYHQGAEKLIVAWDRARGGVLKIRARPVGAADPDLAEAQELFHHLEERSRTGATEQIYRVGILEYDGKAWRGELWLDDNLRLGPPSTQYEQAQRGPRAVIVDARIGCISQGHSVVVMDRLIREVGAFLSVVIGARFHLSQQEQVWISTTDAQGKVVCVVAPRGYFDTPTRPLVMPARGSCSPVPFEPLGLSRVEQAIYNMPLNELAARADIVELWAKYRALPEELRWQFLQVAAKWQEALLHWAERPTACFTAMVNACEALKPYDPAYSEHNIYDVVEALLGKATAVRLHTKLFDPQVHPRTHPQSVRNAHLHRAEFRGSEFDLAAVLSNYRDPTFDTASRELFAVTKAAIIEWLQRGGIFEMPPRERKVYWRRWVKAHALTILPATIIVAFAMGWLVHTLWTG
jgi:hypothetical protein